MVVVSPPVVAVLGILVFAAIRGQQVWPFAFLALGPLLSSVVAALLLRSYSRAEESLRQLTERNAVLERQEAYFRTVVDTIPDVVFAQDAQGRIRMANRATAEILGMPLEGILGKLHAELSNPTGDMNGIGTQIREALDSGKGNSVIRKILHPVAAEERWFETRVVPLVSRNGERAEALVVGTDHTEKLRVREIIQATQQQMLTRMAEAAEFRDGQTGLHTRRVALLAAEISRMIGMPNSEVELIEQAAPLHDIGKIGIPDSILLKPGALTQAEFEIMKTHTLIGGKLLSGGSSELMSIAEQICLLHHERWDGSGYPAGLREDENPRFAQVVWVADVVDALGHSRPYRDAWPLDLIVADLKRHRGRKFSADTVDACIELLTAPGGKERWLADPASTRVRPITSARRVRNGDGQVQMA